MKKAGEEREKHVKTVWDLKVIAHGFGHVHKSGMIPVLDAEEHLSASIVEENYL